MSAISLHDEYVSKIRFLKEAFARALLSYEQIL